MVIDSPFFYLFDKEIPLYGVMFYCGIILAASVALLICSCRELERFDMVCSSIYCMIGAMLGSKLLFFAVNLRTIIDLHVPFVNVLKGGFVFYGGLIGGLLGTVIYSKKYKLPLLDYLDIYAAVLPLGHAIGRVGCFFGGCCYGIPYDGDFSVTYLKVVGDTPLGIPLLPIQLIESVGLLILFIILLTLFLKFPKKNGLVTVVYAISYAIMRFVLEFFRGDDDRGRLGFLSTSQWISIAVVIAVCVYAVHIKKAQ